MAQGILYFLVNEAMPGLVKIGHTTASLEERLGQLSSTGVPKRFGVVASFYVSNSMQCEKDVHLKLKSYRANPKREFFVGSPVKLIEESIFVIGKYLASDENIKFQGSLPKYQVDEDDIYFLLYLLHDCYPVGGSYSSAELIEHHNAYDPVTLDVKLMNLEKYGYVKRINPPHEGIGRWCIMPEGVKLMLDGNHHDQSLLDELR
ncbi:GIY-YIG nuclease family protein [Kiloniella sp. EL199]|uniref:GIY-YIG nuclease family protein n=1 Tax=Kiloniella sp. EL199 TaxID=2107581 RepID=UPI000EA2BECB|nr:GIY-YIG nuclease family protein [Kiloniella sp. EL199]